MGNTVIQKKLRDLACCRDQHCATIYMPVLQGEQVGRQNPIRLKNLLVSAEDALADRGMRPFVARELMVAIEEATLEPDFWEDGSRGLAIFASLERRELMRLPHAVPETWVVGRHFHVTPLLDFETDGSFIVLAISANHCRAFRGDRWTMTPLDIPGLPAGEKEALPTPDHQHTAQAHGGVKHGRSRQTVFTGQGGSSDFAKPELLAYCRQVDAALCNSLGQSTEPLVLSAVRRLDPTYREANHYRHLHSEAIDGSPELQSLHELHRRAWETVLPGFVSQQQRALSQCVRHAAQDRAGGGLHEIVNAAHQGRIETLLISPAVPYWGSFDPSTGQCRLTQAHAPGAEDLLNLAAIETLRHGGDVLAADLSQAGIHDPAAAVFKFPQVAVRPQPAQMPNANVQRNV
ncbi:MAG TPA: hypothetical protein VHY91_18335 [Pirellulales bacterium]|jgi:hypothetical protein|nr:hypothetical protein [Pirellulales bacterium]